MQADAGRAPIGLRPSHAHGSRPCKLIDANAYGAVECTVQLVAIKARNVWSVSYIRVLLCGLQCLASSAQARRQVKPHPVIELPHWRTSKS